MFLTEKSIQVDNSSKDEISRSLTKDYVFSRICKNEPEIKNPGKHLKILSYFDIISRKNCNYYPKDYHRLKYIDKNSKEWKIYDKFKSEKIEKNKIIIDENISFKDSIINPP